MKLKAFIISLLAAAFLCAPALGQVGRVVGVVTDATGNPLKDVEIRIEGIEVRRNYKTKTNKDGKYIHAGVALQGTYRVIASKEGFQSDYAEGVKPAFGGDGQPVNFTLKPGSDRPLAFELTDEQKAEIIRQNEEAEKRRQAFAAVQANFNEGLQLFNAGSYEQAAVKFKEAVAKDAEQPALWAYLGETQDKLGKRPEAIEAYLKAIALSPKDAGLHQNLGNIYAAAGDTDKAKEYYEKSAQLSAALNPSAAATTYYNMGVTYINSASYQEAAGALKKAVELDPNHAEAHYQLGITLLGLNDMPGSIEHLKKYLQLAPGGPNAETAKALVEQLAQ